MNRTKHIRKHLAKYSSNDHIIAMAIITPCIWIANSKRYNKNNVRRFPIDICFLCKSNNASFHCHTIYKYNTCFTLLQYRSQMHNNKHYRFCLSCRDNINKKVQIYQLCFYIFKKHILNLSYDINMYVCCIYFKLYSQELNFDI
jgi:hypothetical protein